MTPQVFLPSGELVLPAMAILLLPRTPDEVAGLLEFQLKKSNDPRQIYEAGLKFFQADFYHKPKRFSGTLVAQFAASSDAAETLLDFRTCILRFEQFSQVWTLPCETDALAEDDPSSRYIRAHNAIFSGRPLQEASVLSFAPQWDRSQAQPMPPGV